MKLLIASCILVLSALTLGSINDTTSQIEVQNDYVTDILIGFGEDFKSKMPNYNLENVSSEAGESIVKNGFPVKENGGKGKRQSKHFVCTSCHNVVPEDPDFSVADPQARLEYVKKNNLPFLQGTTLYGAVNRETFYNGDYYKKYGDLVDVARDDIREAIQLCAVECAQGRELKDWEIESILAYLWDIGLKLNDLNLSQDEIKKISNAKDDVERLYAKELIKSKYLKGSPATFVPPPIDRKAGNGLKGNPNNGKDIYELSCLHCHYQQRYSFLHLDSTNISVNHLRRNMGSFSSHSIYQVIRWGVPVYSGKSSYMPQYPLEKMSEQQLADLRAFLEVGYN